MRDILGATESAVSDYYILYFILQLSFSVRDFSLKFVPHTHYKPLRTTLSTQPNVNLYDGRKTGLNRFKKPVSVLKTYMTLYDPPLK